MVFIIPKRVSILFNVFSCNCPVIFFRVRIEGNNFIISGKDPDISKAINTIIMGIIF